MKEYFCVGSYLPFDTINKSQINNSTAKQTFSFGKSKRFSDFKANCTVVAYGSNQFKTRKEGAKMGFSKRQPIAVANDNPSPARYRIKTEPQERSFSFGLGRQNVKAYDYLHNESTQFPASTKYDISQNFKQLYKNGPFYSMRKKYTTEKQDQTSPGPARYHVLTGKNSNLTLTKYKSVSFSTGKSRRFQNYQNEQPGPGAYKEESGNGSRFGGGGNSRYHSSLGARFSHARRKTYIDDEAYRKASLPGPGNYRAMSEFGQYDGDIYRTFEFPNKKSRQDSTIKSKRPMTSKH